MKKMEKQKQKQTIDLDEFDGICSLWQLIPCGEGKALRKLKLIADSILNGKPEKENLKPLSLLLSGKYAKRTHARCFLRALGIENIKEIPASMLNHPSVIEEYFIDVDIKDGTGYIIYNANRLKEPATKNIYRILSEGLLYRYNLKAFKKEVFPFFGTLIITTANRRYIPCDLQDCFTHHVQLEDYDKAQLERLCLQRLYYAKIRPENDRVLKLLVSLRTSLPVIIKLLRYSVMVMLSEERNVLTENDVREGFKYTLCD